ncbi:hypothetical protein [Leptothoe sp. PORK10 BA2]|uniref:hypothetical protein n=1 Tax=Leptothoe sp. PORK10 BA2 TaxID=3110254 RepID=UPI002B1F4460|nr:hypothetical protein [Leptothoe sp. PORK10 BA2]MEA5463551.1 hypothetical protein [Leptothoe sp. PORK10 BA2]
MSPSRRSNATAVPPAGTAPEADTLVEAYAEDLMDDIFDDVDRILAGDDAAIYGVSAMPPGGTLPLFSAEAITTPAMLVPLSADQAVEARTAAPITETDPASSAPSDGQDGTPSQPSRKLPWKSWLFGAACLSALAAGGVWWMRQQPALQAVTPPVVPSAPAVSQETAFGEYLTRSLRVIGGERSAQNESQRPGVVATASPTPSGNQVTGKPGVIERVFVPLLQPGNGTTTPRTITPGNPSTTAASPALPSPNVARSGQSSQSSDSIPNIAASGTYELVGVLELGDRSAALFEVDGSSQRVYIGETVGGSGWSIVSISNEEVVVRRNGEVRSIYIGQKF